LATHYGILKVAPDAPVEVIRAAYRALAAHHHPDRCADDRDALHRMQRVNEAYRVLADPLRRARYDAMLRLQRRRRACDADTVHACAVPRTDAASPRAMLRERVAATYAAHAALGRNAGR